MRPVPKGVYYLTLSDKLGRWNMFNGPQWSLQEETIDPIFDHKPSKRGEKRLAYSASMRMFYEWCGEDTEGC